MKTFKCSVAHKALLILAAEQAEHLHIKVFYSKPCCFPFIILKLSARCRTEKTRCIEEKYRKILWCLKSVLCLEKFAASHHLQLSLYQYWDKVVELPVMGNSYLTHMARNRETLWTCLSWEEWKSSSLPFQPRDKKPKSCHRFHHNPGNYNAVTFIYSSPKMYWILKNHRNKN